MRYDYESQTDLELEEQKINSDDNKPNPDNEFRIDSLEEVQNLMRGSIAIFKKPGQEQVSLANFKIIKLLGKGA